MRTSWSRSLLGTAIAGTLALGLTLTQAGTADASGFQHQNGWEGSAQLNAWELEGIGDGVAKTYEFAPSRARTGNGIGAIWATYGTAKQKIWVSVPQGSYRCTVQVYALPFPNGAAVSIQIYTPDGRQRFGDSRSVPANVYSPVAVDIPMEAGDSRFQIHIRYDGTGVVDYVDLDDFVVDCSY